MSERYFRAQILMDPEQHSRLRKIAKQEERSISDVARELIERGLNDRVHDQQTRLQRSLGALEQLEKIRTKAFEAHGIYDGDLLSEVRSTREEALDESRWSNSS
jgi:predicted CopG family antitoxin